MTAEFTMAAMELFARHARGAPVVQDGKIVLRYPRAMRWFLGGGAAFFAVVLAAAWIACALDATAKGRATAWLGTLVLGPLVVFCWCESRVRIELDARGIAGRTAFRGHRSLAWCDVESVRYSLGNRWFVLQDRRGERLRVSTLLQGHAVLVAALETQVPEAIWLDAVAAWRRQSG